MRRKHVRWRVGCHTRVAVGEHSDREDQDKSYCDGCDAILSRKILRRLWCLIALYKVTFSETDFAELDEISTSHLSHTHTHGVKDLTTF